LVFALDIALDVALFFALVHDISFCGRLAYLLDWYFFLFILLLVFLIFLSFREIPDEFHLLVDTQDFLGTHVLAGAFLLFLSQPWVLLCT